MCRLLGIRANRPVDLEFSLTGGPRAFRDFGLRNPHGWGMGWYEDGWPSLHKEPIAAVESGELYRVAHRAESTVFVCHVRLATNGEPSIRNCHPFQMDSWLFAHNGSVPRGRLWSALEGERREAIVGETDSEVYFQWILQNIDQRDGNVAEGLRTALGIFDTTPDYSALNFVLTDGHSLYAYRDATRNHDYYSLQYLTRDPDEPLPTQLESEIGALLSSKRLKGERATLVSSEALTDEKWSDIPLGFLLTVSSDLEPDLKSIR